MVPIAYLVSGWSPNTISLTGIRSQVLHILIRPLVSPAANTFTDRPSGAVENARHWMATSVSTLDINCPFIVCNINKLPFSEIYTICKYNIGAMISFPYVLETHFPFFKTDFKGIS